MVTVSGRFCFNHKLNRNLWAINYEGTALLQHAKTQANICIGLRMSRKTPNSSSIQASEQQQPHLWPTTRSGDNWTTKASHAIQLTISKWVKWSTQMKWSHPDFVGSIDSKQKKNGTAKFRFHINWEAHNLHIIARYHSQQALITATPMSNLWWNQNRAQQKTPANGAAGQRLFEANIICINMSEGYTVVHIMMYDIWDCRGEMGKMCARSQQRIEMTTCHTTVRCKI